MSRSERTTFWRLFHLALTLVAAGLLAFPATVLADDNSTMGDPVRGQSLFASKGCVVCHAVRGAGGRIGPDLGRKAAKSSFYEIAAGMWNHSIHMWERMLELRMVGPVFQEDELGDLIAFIFFLNYFDEPGDVRIGKILFTEKHCIQCHRVEGQGGTTGPSLEDLPRGISPLRVAQALWNHGLGMMDSIQQRGLDVPQFGGTEIIDLLAYIRSQGSGREAREFQSPGDPARGKRLFRTKGCSRCHAVFGAKGEVGPDLGMAELEGSVTQIAGRMWNHWPDMAEAMQMLDMPLPRFSKDELGDLLAYLFISRYSGPGGDPERGAEAYRDLGCAFCHGLDGEGTLGPPLQQVTTGGSKESITQDMWNHAPHMWDEMGLHQIPWPRFEPQELADLLAFLTTGWESP
jgi:mono/diheme cytochrome c family protein